MKARKVSVLFAGRGDIPAAVPLTLGREKIVEGQGIPLPRLAGEGARRAGEGVVPNGA